MKRILMLSVFLISALGLTLCPALTFADLVDIYVDSAPNKYGSAAYPAWEVGAFSGAADGSFVNMANGINPANVDTTDFEIQDEVVYSLGDTGKRLHFVYYVAGQTVESLDGRFQVSLTNLWNGNFQDYFLENFQATWLQPNQWVDYDADGDGTIDGVVGTAGAAWWGAYNTKTQEELDIEISNLNIDYVL